MRKLRRKGREQKVGEDKKTGGESEEDREQTRATRWRASNK
jgi:hypothetical protein